MICTDSGRYIVKFNENIDNIYYGKGKSGRLQLLCK